MPMKAILIVPENYSLILTEMGIPEALLERVQRSGKTYQSPFYFIPRYINADGEPTGWMALSQASLDEQFTYNKDWIKIRFVSLTRK